MEISPVCINCKHYTTLGTCKAFKIIPPKIWSEGDDHSKPLPDQKNDITFTPLNDE